MALDDVVDLVATLTGGHGEVLRPRETEVGP